MKLVMSYDFLRVGLWVLITNPNLQIKIEEGRGETEKEKEKGNNELSSSDLRSGIDFRVS